MKTFNFEGELALGMEFTTASLGTLNQKAASLFFYGVVFCRINTCHIFGGLK